MTANSPSLQMYHGTTMSAWLHIRREGLKPSADGYVYLASNPVTAGYFAWSHWSSTPAILAVQVSPEELEPDPFELDDRGITRRLFKNKCFRVHGHIPANRVKLYMVNIPEDWKKLYRKYLGPKPLLNYFVKTGILPPAVFL